MSINIYTIPFTYLIGWSKHNKWYYGVRYAKGCHPNDLFTTYFTSSKIVKDYIKTNGMPDIVKIRRVFQSIEKAVMWEHNVLKKLKVNIKEEWLNKTYNGCFSYKGIKNTTPGMLAAQQKLKGKTYEEIYGYEKATELKEKRSKSSKKNWSTPGFSEKYKHKTKEHNLKNSQSSKLSWQDPVIRQKRIEAMRNRKNTVR